MCCSYDARIVAYLDAAGDFVFRLVGPTLIVAALILLVGATYTFFWILFSHFVDLYTAHGVVFFAACVFITFNVYFNYYMAITTDPGRPNPEQCDPSVAAEAGEIETNPRMGRFSRYCRKCRMQKPPRTHHCSACQRCVLKMDHHCPWINNCVGFYNQRYFVLFMVYIWIGALICTLTAGAIFTSRTRFARLPDHNARTAVIFVLIAALSCWLGVTFLLAWHMYLVCTGQTTIEFYSNREQAAAARRRGEAYSNEYDLGWRLNFRDHFGAGGPPLVGWAMPRRTPPHGDGHSFPTLRGLARAELLASSKAPSEGGSKAAAAIGAFVGAVAGGGPGGAQRIALKEAHSA